MSELDRLSKERHLALSDLEKRVIVDFFVRSKRPPSMAELEMIAQAWSEHTRHKTLRGEFRVGGQKLGNGAKKPPLRRAPGDAGPPRGGSPAEYRNLLKETVFEATRRLKRPWVWSAFKDNAGIIALDGKWGVAVKVETHNHPSALDPYGGASTGIGGVIRDVLGTGLSAHPIASLDVFCVEPGKPRVVDALAAGVRDYGNRMGIPTVAGLIYWDEAYKGLPLVFCGTVGLIRRDRVEKRGPKPGDLVYLLGGKTGRDGIHGATFSSQKLTDELTTSVVQIGNPILEKKVWDFLVEASKADCFNSITDLGAGGIACAIWELADLGGLGVRAKLDGVALKEPGMEGWEVLVSESQERMMISVPPGRKADAERLLAAFEFDFACLGEFTREPSVEIGYHGESLVNVPIKFLRDVPKRSFTVESAPKVEKAGRPRVLSVKPRDVKKLGLKILSSPNIASKERIIRQYDHEVGGRTLIKPLTGKRGHAPSDAVVLRPLYDSWKGAALGLGWSGALAKIDSRVMALAAFDEALRNVVAVGGGLTHIAALDNYCAGSTADKKVLSELVIVSEALKDAALAYGVPFVSGKDSLNNTTSDNRNIPTVMLVTALGVLKDARRTLSVVLKKPGNFLYLVGRTQERWGGSAIAGLLKFNGPAPEVDLTTAPGIHKSMSWALGKELAVSCHDVSEGGVFVALSEMMMDSGLGLEADCPENPALLFDESPTRFLVEVEPDKAKAFDWAMKSVSFKRLGRVTKKPLMKLVQGKRTLGQWTAVDLEKAFRGKGE
ncbi:MAG: phosphoribosylformylglycinamidine synthase subunit PurL [Elusimicrobia bacterium]|nr:phosphoribosylformylglycinamidine synthase subunit PurL [Elusimicrobiota bacterium]